MSLAVTSALINEFRQTVWQFYAVHKRDMPWRSEPTPYFVFVSEMMLQQTQVPRVLQKFTSFVARFPDFEKLSRAPLSHVLEEWSGLGYNRRAKFLWQAAQKIVGEFAGQLPKSQQELMSLPGIGPNTAGAILAYAFNEPVVFVETNIRTVFIYHFFADHSDAVDDNALRAIIAQALPAENACEWYWALMDYGTHLKTTAGSQLHRVKNYRPQSTFAGSRRQIRGHVLRVLLQQKSINEKELARLIPDTRLAEVIQALLAEDLLVRREQKLYLAGD